MTKSRPEMIVEGSANGTERLDYIFSSKPGDLDRALPWLAPHQPRLGCQLGVCGAGVASPATGSWVSLGKSGSSAQPPKRPSTMRSKTRRTIDAKFVEP